MLNAWQLPGGPELGLVGPTDQRPGGRLSTITGDKRTDSRPCSYIHTWGDQWQKGWASSEPVGSQNLKAASPVPTHFAAMGPGLPDPLSCPLGLGKQY